MKQKIAIFIGGLTTIFLFVVVNILLGKPAHQQQQTEIKSKAYNTLIERIIREEPLNLQTKEKILEAIKDKKISESEYESIMKAFSQRLQK